MGESVKEYNLNDQIHNVLIAKAFGILGDLTTLNL